MSLICLVNFFSMVRYCSNVTAHSLDNDLLVTQIVDAQHSLLATDLLLSVEG